MSLPTRELGTSGLQITRLGFGSWAAGGGGWAFGWGPQADAASLAAMRHAVELGVNWLDTAAVYGFGHCEELVAPLLRELPAGERPFVFTKCGYVWGDDPMESAQRVLTPESIRRECEASLRRLGVERIDLYQFHFPDDDMATPVEDSWATMAELRREGKVRCAGVSNYDVADLERIESICHVDSLQPPLSLVCREAAAAEIPWCAAHGTGVIVHSPMRNGLLTDGFTPERVARLPEDDWRKCSPRFQSPQLEQGLALRDALRPVAERHGVSVATVAVAWTLAWPGVTGAIVGARSPAQVDGWIAASRLELNSEDLDEIATAIRRTGAGSGPLRPTSGGRFALGPADAQPALR